ncbi:MAG TPA: Glu-tRNA(Gln) amidotransferase subunit GatD [Alphaproteobacteria bacterium]|nr:Glu-tRNA(Gln) amidotransferase subunit GatD [Alphaproteobacteria bacterium]
MKHVKITVENGTNTEHLEGILVKEDEKHLVLKLSSGYNIGFQKNKISKIEEIQSHKELEKEKKSHETHEKIIHGDGLPKILILHTGGTIASKVDYETGAVTPKFTPEELLGLFPEIKDIAKIESKLLKNMASDDMRFSHYNLIATSIESELNQHKDLKGIILTQGTDTLHYTSAALSFMFENLHVPIVIVGSQRSSDRGSSDAAMNLISAVAFIANTTLSGVFICMHESINDDSCSILNGINARKMHSSRRDAFKQINGRPIAKVDFATKNIEYISEYPNSPLNAKGHLKVHKFNEDLKIGMVVSHPQMFAEEFDSFEKFDGLVLQGTGLGHFPINDEKENLKIKQKIKELASKIPLVMSVQTIGGPVNMNVYSPGRELVGLGVLGNHSTLTPETSFIKLAWLLSQNLNPVEYYMKDLRGEFGIKGSE